MSKASISMVFQKISMVLNSDFLIGLICGIILSPFICGGLTYITLSRKDKFRKRKETRFQLGTSIKKGPSPRLLSLDDE